MQQEAIPFKQSPRSFVITVFILIIIVYVSQLFGKYTLPPLARRISAFWGSKRDRAGEVGKLLKGEVGGALQTMRGLDPGKTLGDEENNIPRSLWSKSTTWTDSWRTGTTVG
jgi:hypothetical protein